MAIQANRDVDTVGKSNTAFVGLPASVPTNSITVVVNKDADVTRKMFTINHLRRMIDYARENNLSTESAGTFYIAGDPELGIDNIRTEAIFANITASENAIGFSGNIRTRGDNFLIALLRQTIDSMREQGRLFN